MPRAWSTSPNIFPSRKPPPLPCAAVTAWNALFVSGGLNPGDSVLTLGTGGVSIFALQFARIAGARVIATSSSEAKLEKLRALGANDLIDYKTIPEWDKPVRDLTGGVGVDHVVEVGGAGTLPLSIKSVRRGGHIALIGVLTGGGEIDPRPVLLKSIKTTGHLRRLARNVRGHEPRHRALPPETGIDRIFPAAEVHDAMKYMLSGAHFGKVCVVL